MYVLVLTTFLCLYIITGLVRVAYDFYHRDIMSAEYVRHPKLFETIAIILIWPFSPIYSLFYRYRRWGLKNIMNLYLLPFFWAVTGYAMIIQEFATIYTDDTAIQIKIFMTILILVVFCGTIWWLCYRRDRILNKLKRK